MLPENSTRKYKSHASCYFSKSVGVGADDVGGIDKLGDAVVVSGEVDGVGDTTRGIVSEVGGVAVEGIVEVGIVVGDSVNGGDVGACSEGVGGDSIALLVHELDVITEASRKTKTSHRILFILV